jgi:ligand-binding sensor domain-containing protein
MIYQKSIFALIVLLVLNFRTFGQVGKWQNFTNMKFINKIAVTDNGIWAGTSGGVFYYSYKNKSYEQFTTTEGLKSINISAVALDHQGRVWFGSVNGNIDIYDPSTKAWTYIVTIANSEKTKKRINDFLVKDTVVYVSTDFGVSIIYATTLIFGDTYNKLGSFGADLRVNSVFLDDTLWAATEKGIAVQKYGLSNYLTPNSWQNFSTAQGLPSQYVSSIIRYRDTLYVGTQAGLTFLQGSTFIKKPGLLFSANVIDMISKGDSLFIATRNSVYVYYQGNFTLLYSDFGGQITDLAKSGSSKNFFASSTIGIPTLVGSSINLLAPLGPTTNLFPSITVDGKGKLWAASGTDIANQGFYRLDESGWKNYLVNEYPIMGANSYHKTIATSNNTVWMLGWGYGALKIKDDSLVIRYSNANVDSLVGIPINKDFIVISGVAEDSKKNIWLLNRDAGNEKILSKLTPDGKWTYYQNGYNSKAVLLDDIVIDKYDTKWLVTALSTQTPITQGVYYFNETGATSKTWGFLTSANGLNGPPTSIAVDLRGEIWVGTNLGVNVVTNPTQPEQRVTSIFAVRQQYINCITVDGLNNKWIGTRSGLWVLSPDGNSLMAQYNTRNSPILSDDIKSIAINDKNGLVYIGTNNGLSSLYTLSIKPLESFEKLELYPNPFYIDKSKGQKLTIDGLVNNSSIKILSVEGNLITEISTPGGRTSFWNGRDKDSNFVSSGIYFIIAYNEDGEQIATGKVAVINR